MKIIKRHFECLKNKGNIIEIASISLVYIFLITLVIIRSFYGVEMTDEIHYVAEAYITTNGATPYVNIWSQTSGFALLNAPFVWFYTLITGSTEGILLYFRIISLFIKTTFIFLILLIMRNIIKPKITAIWLLPIITFTPYSVMSLSYDVWAILLLMFSGICLTRATLSECIKERNTFASVAGVSCALGILAYPITIIVACFLFLFSLGYELFCPRQKSEYKVTLGFLIGGLLTACVITLFFIVRTGEILGILNGLKVIIYDNPYHQLPKNITRESVTLMLGYYKIWLKLVFTFLVIYFIPFINTKFKKFVVVSYVLYYIFRDSYYIFYPNLLRVAQSLAIPQITSVLCRQLFFIPLLIFPFLIEKNRSKSTALILFLYLPAFIHTMTASLLAQNGMNKRYFFLFQGMILIIPFIYWLILDIRKNEKFEKLSEFFALLSSVLCSLTFFAIFLLNYYGYVYRDNPISQLNYKVESGIYKGLYTTEGKGKGLEELEKTIRLETNHSEKILFMDNAPMAYLMTDATHCAPSTWEIQSYSYGFKDDKLLRKYFERTGCTPDKIIYIFTGRDKVLSIDSENYKFNDYVNTNYKLTKEIKGYFPIKIYTNITNHQ